MYVCVLVFPETSETKTFHIDVHFKTKSVFLEQVFPDVHTVCVDRKKDSITALTVVNGHLLFLSRDGSRNSRITWRQALGEETGVWNLHIIILFSEKNSMKF